MVQSRPRRRLRMGGCRRKSQRSLRVCASPIPHFTRLDSDSMLVAKRCMYLFTTTFKKDVVTYKNIVGASLAAVRYREGFVAIVAALLVCYTSELCHLHVLHLSTAPTTPVRVGQGRSATTALHGAILGGNGRRACSAINNGRFRYMGMSATALLLSHAVRVAMPSILNILEQLHMQRPTATDGCCQGIWLLY